jgi:hypothetical protein
MISRCLNSIGLIEPPLINQNRKILKAKFREQDWIDFLLTISYRPRRLNESNNFGADKVIPPFGR